MNLDGKAALTKPAASSADSIKAIRGEITF
jgi:hypothetical protein